MDPTEARPFQPFVVAISLKLVGLDRRAIRVGIGGLRRNLST